MSLANRIEKMVLALALCLCAGLASADVVVVVSAKSPLSSLSAGQLADIFLGRSGYFPHGERAVPLDQPEGSAARNEFYRKYAGRTPAQIKAHWSKLVFTGRGHPPKEVDRAHELKRLLAENGQSIGYLDRSAVDGTVKIVSIVDE